MVVEEEAVVAVAVAGDLQRRWAAVVSGVVMAVKEVVMAAISCR